MQLRSRRVVLQVEGLEDRTVPTLLPNPLLDAGHPEFAPLASVANCGRDPSITGRCAPELPEWLLPLLHAYAQTAVDVVLPLGWGQEARDIYRAFLDGPFDQRDYADGHEVVEGNAQAVGFRASAVTRHVTEELLEALRAALVESFTLPPPRGIDCGGLPADEEFAIPVRQSGDEGLLTGRQLRDFELSLEYENTREIPGIFAGGISDSRGVGMDDRTIDGFLMVTRRTLDGQTVALDLRTELTIWVYDSIDFCPGGLGDWLAQLLTRPLQLLQANDWARAVPFTVTFTAESLGLTLQGEELPASCHGPEPAPGRGENLFGVDLANGIQTLESSSSHWQSGFVRVTVPAALGGSQDPSGSSAERVFEPREQLVLPRRQAETPATAAPSGARRGGGDLHTESWPEFFPESPSGIFFELLL